MKKIGPLKENKDPKFIQQKNVTNHSTINLTKDYLEKKLRFREHNSKNIMNMNNIDLQ